VNAPPLPDFSRAKVLIAGDVMADIYWGGTASRISPEAPVPVVLISHEELRPGGAANVALNVASLGAQATLVGAVGDDITASELEASLRKKSIGTALLRIGGTPTIRKLRVVSRRQQIVRLDFERDFASVASDLKSSLVLERIGHSDVLVLSDYAKGFLGPEVAQVIRLARAAGKPVVVDPKGTDYSRYAGATVITPNLSEFEAVVGRCADEAALIERGQNLRDRLALDALLVTRGEDGMTLLQRGSAACQLASMAREVYDVTGAGDTVVATIAASIAAGTALRDAVELSNVAAGLVVAKSGTAAVSMAELQRALATGLRADSSRKIVDQPTLKDIVASVKGRGKTVVMTNGCFDILHAGHVDLLQRARDLGDLLVVAVNDDDSVSRLKGPTRPVNALSHRLKVLAGLECVDRLIVFREDSPENLYREILPDILVKGGDYSADQVAGGAFVTKAGGRVMILELVDGLSTTGILAKATP